MMVCGAMMVSDGIFSMLILHVNPIYSLCWLDSPFLAAVLGIAGT